MLYDAYAYSAQHMGPHEAASAFIPQETEWIYVVSGTCPLDLTCGRCSLWNNALQAFVVGLLQAAVQ